MPRPEDVSAGRTRDWQPKYPDFALTPEQGAYDEAQSGGAPYEPAPDTSHVYGWKLQSGGFVSKFYAPSIGAPSGTVAVLGVAFKPSAPRGSTSHPNTISSEYVYAFTNLAEAEDYLARFRAAAHPGHVVQDLIAARVWYKKVTAT